MAGQVGPESTDIDTVEKAQEFIKSSLVGAREKAEELKEVIETDALLNGLNRIGHKNAVLVEQIELVRLMASARFFETTSDFPVGKDISLTLQQGIEKIIAGEIRKGITHFDINDPFGPKNETLLMYATQYNLHAASHFLIDQEGTKINAMDDQGRTALTRAVCANAKDTVIKLFEKGADPFEEDEYQQTPAMKAAATGSADVFDAILEKAKDATQLEEKAYASIPFKETTLGKMLHAESKQLWTVMHYAANKGSTDIMAMLFAIPGKADDMVRLLQQQEKTGRTPLMIAAGNGKSGSAAAILEFVNVHATESIARMVDAPDNYENTALDDAVRYGHPEAVEVLRNYGAIGKVFTYRDQSVKTILTVAERLCQEEKRVLALASADSHKFIRAGEAGEYDSVAILKEKIDLHLNRENFRNKQVRMATVEAMAKGNYQKILNVLQATEKQIVSYSQISQVQPQASGSTGMP